MKDERDYCADVAYEVWRRGGNPDAVVAYELYDDRVEGVDPFDAAERYLPRCRYENEGGP